MPRKIPEPILIRLCKEWAIEKDIMVLGASDENDYHTMEKIIYVTLELSAKEYFLRALRGNLDDLYQDLGEYIFMKVL